MQNISIPEIIANLKGIRGYEEKKAQQATPAGKKTCGCC